MNAKKYYFLLGGLAAAVMVALALVFGLVLFTGSEDVGGAGVAPAVSDGAGGATSEGIKVHGHWTIEVREPDGTLVRRTEFDNALTTNGARRIASLLARSGTAGKWQVSLTFTQLVGGGGGITLNEVAPFLSVTVPSTGPDANKLVLSGQATITAGDGTITQVKTRQGSCFSSITPDDCAPPFQSSPIIFTDATLPTPLAFVADQVIQFTVAISFQ